MPVSEIAAGACRMKSSMFSMVKKPPKEGLDTNRTSVQSELSDNREVFLKEYTEQEGRTGGLCMGIHAPWSKGKTLTLVFFAKRRNELEGLPVIANFRMTGIKPFMFLDDIELIKETFSAIVQIDEIRRYMDSYMSRGHKARFCSNLAADLGKQSCDLYYTDQHFNAAPPRIKANLSILGEPDFDEETQWVTLYLYQTIEDFLMKNPFFYFGFYGPDFWRYYDTKYKVDDYKLKFKVDRYAKMFTDWLAEQEWAAGVKISNSVMNLWNQAEGAEMTKSELGAILTFMNIKDKENKRPARVIA